jgi:4-hydroxybenzoate polyprenyltransferase
VAKDAPEPEAKSKSPLAHWLKVSRPGLWFPTVWLYLMPLSGSTDLRSAGFWAGLFFVTFPLNFLIYGWNDLVDAETDANNPRKDSYLFGARPTATQRAQLPLAIGAVVALSFLPVAWLGGPVRMLALLAGIIGVCALYNHPTAGLRGRPPLELLCQLAYLLVVPIAVWLNGAVMPPWPTLVYLSLFCVQSQLIGEVMDVLPDRAAGRATSATVLGIRGAKGLIIAIVAAEVVLLAGMFGDLLFAGVLAAFLAWLVADVTLLFRGRAYTLPEMRLFGFGSNGVALATMAYVWWSGCLLKLDGPLAALVTGL